MSLNVYTLIKSHAVNIDELFYSEDFCGKYQKLYVTLLHTSNIVESHSVKVLKDLGISPEQYHLMKVLHKQHPNPANVTCLQDKMLNKMSNASRLVEKLRQKNLVERHECPLDRRQCHVKLTDKGLELLKSADKNFLEIQDVLRTLDYEQVETLNNLLDKVRNSALETVNIKTELEIA